jgi:hypothetical protein
MLATDWSLLLSPFESVVRPTCLVWRTEIFNTEDNKFFTQSSTQTHNSSDTVSYTHTHIHIQCLWQTIDDIRQSVTRKDRTHLRKSDTHLDIEKNSEMFRPDLRFRGAASASTQTSAPFSYSGRFQLQISPQELFYRGLSTNCPGGKCPITSVHVHFRN